MMSENYPKFSEIKEAVSIEMALQKLYNHSLKKVNNFSFRGSCILPSHPAGLVDDSFSVNPDKQVWICHNTSCQKARKGRKGGDVIELVAVMENCTLKDAGIKLHNTLFLHREAFIPKLSSAPQSAEISAPLEKYGVYSPLCAWLEQIEASETDEYAKHLLGTVLRKAVKLASL